MEESTLERLADLICGDASFAPIYRSSWYLTSFFESIGLSKFKHDGSTRKVWVLGRLKECSNEELTRVILGLASPKTYKGNVDDLELALKSLNEVLNPEGLNLEINGVKPIMNNIEPRLSRPLSSSTSHLIEKQTYTTASLSDHRLSVFLCHSTQDKTYVRTLYERLNKEGFDPWLDEEKLLP